MSKLDKYFSVAILIFTLIVFGFLFGFNAEQNNQFKVARLDSSPINSSDKQITDYNFDSINISGKVCTINGWAIIRGIDSNYVTPTIILVDDKNNFYKVKTRISKRNDVTQKINDGKTYDNSGIEAKFNVEGLDKSRKYTIVVQVEINKTVYTKWTGVQLPLQ